MDPIEIIETLCKEHREIMKQFQELTKRKEELNAKILSLLNHDKVETPFYKITKVKQLSVKTSMDDARHLGCMVVKEDINKEALKELHRQGLPVPGITINEWVLIKEKYR